MPLKVLDSAFVGLGLFHGRECSQVAPLACLGILFSGVEAVFTGFKFTDHTENWMTTGPGTRPFDGRKGLLLVSASARIFP